MIIITCNNFGIIFFFRRVVEEKFLILFKKETNAFKVLTMGICQML